MQLIHDKGAEQEGKGFLRSSPGAAGYKQEEECSLVPALYQAHKGHPGWIHARKCGQHGDTASGRFHGGGNRGIRVRTPHRSRSAGSTVKFRASIHPKTSLRVKNQAMESTHTLQISEEKTIPLKTGQEA